MTSPSIASQSTSSQQTSDLPPSVLLGRGNYESLIRGKLPISSPDDDVSDNNTTSQWAPEHPPLSHVIGEISRLRRGNHAMTSHRGERPPLMTSSLMQGELKKPQPQLLRISSNQLQRHRDVTQMVPPSYDVTMKRRRRKLSSGSGGSLRRKEEEHDSGVAINQNEEKMVFV